MDQRLMDRGRVILFRTSIWVEHLGRAFRSRGPEAAPLYRGRWARGRTGADGWRRGRVDAAMWLRSAL